MDAARRALRIAIALVACACATPAQRAEEACRAALEPPPLPSAACFWSDEGQRHAGRMASEIADALMGYVSHPGAAELRVGFGDDARVASVCTDGRVEGSLTLRRLPEAIARLERLPAGPACFAGRRLDFAWESPEVTHQLVRDAVRECRRQVEGHRRRNLFCHEMQRCPVEEVTERWDVADRELRSCVLAKVPLELHVAGSADAHLFVPAAGSEPDPDLAIQALDVCEALGDRPTLEGCMRRHGWEPRP